MVVCLVFDIDDTIFIHKSENIDYDGIQTDPKLNKLLQDISYPKYVLTNATFSHANVVVNKMGIHHHFEKIYSRDNIPEMKPSGFCYRSVTRDIAMTLFGNMNNKIIFFDDLLTNLEGAKKQGWNTVWISPNYLESYKFSFVDRAFPTIHDALEQIIF